MADPLTGNKIRDTYTKLLKLGSTTLTALRTITLGNGAESALSISDSAAKVDGDLEVTGDIVNEGLASALADLGIKASVFNKYVQSVPNAMINDTFDYLFGHPHAGSNCAGKGHLNVTHGDFGGLHTQNHSQHTGQNGSTTSFDLRGFYPLNSASTGNQYFTNPNVIGLFDFYTAFDWSVLIHLKMQQDGSYFGADSKVLMGEFFSNYTTRKASIVGTNLGVQFDENGTHFVKDGVLTNINSESLAGDHLLEITQKSGVWTCRLHIEGDGWHVLNLTGYSRDRRPVTMLVGTQGLAVAYGELHGLYAGYRI